MTKKYEWLFETVSWLIVLVAIFSIKILPVNITEDSSFYILVGVFLSFLIITYYAIWKVFPYEKRLYVQNIAQVAIIGLLIYFAKDTGIYFFSLFLLPIIATALTLDTLPSVLLITLTCVFVGLETLLNPPASAWGLWQIALIVLITIFCRFLALEIKRQRELKIQAELKKKESEEAERLGKEFITLASHQLLTPLSIIRGFVSMLRAGDLGKLNPEQKNAINQIYNNSVKMIHLVEELLTVSRLEAGKLPFYFKKINLIPLISQVISSVGSASQAKKLFLKFQKPAEESIFVNADPEKIENVLLNLLDNAIKYTNKGGVTVKLKTKKAQGKTEVIVSISDTGVGIPVEYQERIFQPFFRGKNILELDKRGTGLGLYIAKSFIQKHNGKIWAESEEGKGSTFYFSLPAIKNKIKEQRK